MHFNITVHYENGNHHIYDGQNEYSSLLMLGQRYNQYISVWRNSGMDICKKYPDGYFEVVEISEDKKDVWVEFVTGVSDGLS